MQTKIPVYAAEATNRDQTHLIMREISIAGARLAVRSGYLADVSPISERQRGRITHVQEVEHIRSGQAVVYEMYGAEKHRRLFQGGLTRTETQPNPKPSILTWGHLGEKPSLPSNSQLHIRREPGDR